MTLADRESRELIRQKMSQAYSEITIDHALNPRNMGAMAGADGWSRITSSCGDTMEIWLKVGGDTISEAAFLTDGCAATIAAGSMVTQLTKGKSIPQALKINQSDILCALDGLPEGNKHCALLAANTLKEAVKDYLVFKKEPWKKAYRSNR